VTYDPGRALIGSEPPSAMWREIKRTK